MLMFNDDGKTKIVEKEEFDVAGLLKMKEQIRDRKLNIQYCFEYYESEKALIDDEDELLNLKGWIAFMLFSYYNALHNDYIRVGADEDKIEKTRLKMFRMLKEMDIMKEQKDKGKTHQYYRIRKDNKFIERVEEDSKKIGFY